MLSREYTLLLFLSDTSLVWKLVFNFWTMRSGEQEKERAWMQNDGGYLGTHTTHIHTHVPKHLDAQVGMYRASSNQLAVLLGRPGRSKTSGIPGVVASLIYSS